MSDIHDLFGAPIFEYTRQQAIEDGELWEASNPENDTANVCQQHFPGQSVCVAPHLFSLIKTAVENPKYANDYAGIMHDLCHMSKLTPWPNNTETLKSFTVIIQGGVPGSTKKVFTLYLARENFPTKENPNRIGYTFMLPEDY